MILVLAAALVATDAPGDGGGYVQTLDPCEAASYSDPGAPDILAWQAARNGNAMDGYRSFLTLYPRSVCAAAAKQMIAARKQGAAHWVAEYARDGIKGPAPAMLRGDPAMGITDEDYPALAQRNGEEGTVAVAYDVATDGQMENCRVTQSSGSDSLDKTTCRIITRRARFKPARDAAGKPVRSQGSRRIVWQIPRVQIPYVRPLGGATR